MDLCLIIDSSGSIRDNNPPDGSRDNWNLQLEFLASLIDLFTIGPTDTKIGAVVFSEEASVAFDLDTYRKALYVKYAILGLEYIGTTTNTPEGFKVTREQCFSPANGERPRVLNLAIIITDGVPFPAVRFDSALREAKLLKQIATVIAIGVTDFVNVDLLKSFSSPPQIENQNWYKSVSFTNLNLITRSVGIGLCQTWQGIVSA